MTSGIKMDHDGVCVWLNCFSHTNILRLHCIFSLHIYPDLIGMSRWVSLLAFAHNEVVPKR